MALKSGQFWMIYAMSCLSISKLFVRKSNLPYLSVCLSSVRLLHRWCIQDIWSKAWSAQRRCLLDLGRIYGFSLHITSIPLVSSSRLQVLQASLWHSSVDLGHDSLDYVHRDSEQSYLHDMDLFGFVLRRRSLYDRAQHFKADLWRLGNKLVWLYADLYWSFIADHDRIAWKYPQWWLLCVLLDHCWMLFHRPLHPFVRIQRGEVCLRYLSNQSSNLKRQQKFNQLQETIEDSLKTRVHDYSNLTQPGLKRSNQKAHSNRNYKSSDNLFSILSFTLINSKLLLCHGVLGFWGFGVLGGRTK